MSINIKSLLFYLFTFGISCPAVASPSAVDSLYHALESSSEDTFKVNILLDLCWQLHRVDVDEFEDLANQSLELSQKLDFRMGIGRSYNYLAGIQISKGNYDDALKFSLIAVNISEKIDARELSISSYSNIAHIYSMTGRPDEALAIWQSLVNIAEKSGHIETISTNYLNMGLLLKNNNNSKEAQRYFLQALKAAKKGRQDVTKSIVYLEIAGMYVDEGNLNRASRNFSKALKLANKSSDTWVAAFAILGLSDISLRKGNKELALTQARLAVEMTKEIGDNIATITANSKLAEILRTIGKYEESLLISLFIIELAKENNIHSEHIKGCLDASKTYREIEDFEKAFFYSEKYHDLRDSTFSEEKAKNILHLEKKYQSDLKEKENTVLRLQQQKHKRKIKQNNTLNKALLSILILLTIVGFLAYSRYLDKISKHKILEEKVNERTEELRLMNNNLEKSNRELERFAYIASHDLREPLRNISGFSGLLKKALKPKEGSNIEEYLSFITENTIQLNTLVQDILTYSKLNEGSEALIMVDPNLVISEINKSLTHSIKQKKVKIFVEGNLPLIKSSGRQVYFLFKNLIENGIKYNDNPFPRIDIVCHTLEGEHEFLVKDNGIGIDPKYSAKVFEMFTRLHNRQQFKGTGLGLSLCKKIVENHGGTIHVESKEGKGSSFIFTLPTCILEKNEEQSKNRLPVNI